jgi:rare lipoprotein A
VVRINDRGPYYGDRCLDLSASAFASIADPSAGVIDVRYEVLAQDAT